MASARQHRGKYIDSQNGLQQCLCSAQYQGQCVSKAMCRKSTLNITEINHASPVLKMLTLYLFSSLQICFSKGHSPCYYVLFKISRKGLEAILFASHLAEQNTPSRRQSTPFVVIFSKCWTNFSWSKVDIILDYLAYGSQKKKTSPLLSCLIVGVSSITVRYFSDNIIFFVSVFKYLPNKIIHKYTSFF